jgi:hypothetical protein
MDTLLVPAPVREKLGDAASDGLLTMLADTYRLATESFERRLDHAIGLATERFERRLGEEISKLRVEISDRISDLRFDLLKWSFLFWIGQLAAMTGILSLLLRNIR